MNDRPDFDGRKILTAGVVNDLIRKNRQNNQVFVAPPLSLLNMGSAGKIISAGTSTGSSGGDGATGSGPVTPGAMTGVGFWARVYATPRSGDMAPSIRWAEQQLLTQPTTASAFADLPNGRSGDLDSLNFQLQSLISCWGTPQQVWEVSLAGKTNGTFTVSVVVTDSSGNNPVTYTTSSLPYNCTLASFKTALTTAFSAATPAIVPSVGGQDGSPLAFSFPTNINTLLQQSSVTASFTASDSTVTSLTLAYYTPSAGTNASWNIAAGGEIVWVQPMTDASGTVRYLFQLPYCGFWARIVSVQQGSSPPLSLSYSFVQQIPTVGGYVDNFAGITGTCWEINNEPMVPPGAVVWLTPLFFPDRDIYYVFQFWPDIRLLVYRTDSGVPSGANCIVLYGRPGDRAPVDNLFGTSSFGFMRLPNGMPGNYSSNTNYIGLRTGFNAQGFPTYAAPDSITAGWSGSLPPVNDTLGHPHTITVVNGRVVSVS